jgi:hypothetical protein
MGAIFTSATAAAILVLGATRLMGLVEPIYPDSLDWRAAASSILALATLLLAGRLGLLGTTGLRKALLNPPPWLHACIAAAFAMVFWIWFPGAFPRALFPLRHENLLAVRWYVFGGLACLSVAPIFLGRVVDLIRRRRPAVEDGAVDLRMTDLRSLRAWIRTDDEITEPSQDAFGHRHIAWRMADRLVEAGDGCLGRGATFALVGELGSGKSSIRQLVRSRFEARGYLDSKLVFVDVSLWPFESADAAIRGILTSIEGGLARLTCTTSVSRIADRYLRVVEKLDGHLGTLATLLAEDKAPQDVLSAYDRLAQLLGVQIVVWIEDLERFEGSGPDTEGRTAPVRGLLHGLQRFDHITVVVASNSLDARIDLEKIARFVERVPRLGILQAWPIISRFRHACQQGASTSGMSLLLDPFQGPLAGDYTAEIDAIVRTLPAAMSEKGAIVYLCRTPRMLKQALRTTLDVWDHLHGEIDFDDVLLMSVVRACQPDIFSLVESNIDHLRGSVRRDAAGQRNGAASAFQQSLERLVGHDAALGSAIDRILDSVFPFRKATQSDDQGKLQGLGNRTDEYWRRFLAVPELAETERDQPVIAAIREWNTGRSNSLVHLISSAGTSDIVERFGRLLLNEGALRLLEEIAKERIAEDPALWPEAVFPDHRPPPGVGPLWRIVRQSVRGKPLPSGEVVATLERILAFSVPVKLPVAHEFVHLFLTHDPAVSSVLSDSAKASLIVKYEELLRGYSTRPPTDLSKALAGSELHTLSWVCWRLDRLRRREHLAGVPFDGWRDFSDVVLRAADSDPATMIPQLLPFMVSEEADPFAGLDGRRPAIVFDADRAERLFGLLSLAKLFERHPPESMPGLPEAILQVYTFARTEIANSLKKKPSPKLSRDAAAVTPGGSEPTV